LKSQALRPSFSSFCQYAAKDDAICGFSFERREELIDGDPLRAPEGIACGSIGANK
jgi:hypothetical protein